MGKNGGACGCVLHMRGGYRDSDIVRHYVLVMTPAPQGVEEHELLRAIHVLSTRLAPLLLAPIPALLVLLQPSSSCPYPAQQLPSPAHTEMRVYLSSTNSFHL